MVRYGEWDMARLVRLFPLRVRGRIQRDLGRIVRAKNSLDVRGWRMPGARAGMIARAVAGPSVVVLALLVLLPGCGDRNAPLEITLWHQMTPNERVALDELLERFHETHPDIRVRALYKETEELRSGFQSATLAGAGPELIYGPSDTLGAYVTMGIVQDLSPWLDAGWQSQFVPQALTFYSPPDRAGSRWLVQAGDRVGNHLALVYNRQLIDHPPATTDELIAMARRATVDRDGDGRMDQYGLVWNYVEPFFLIPWITGYGGWVFEGPDSARPALDSEACVEALQFVADLQRRHQVVPANCDYDTADALFKDGQAAMIINGDWSWADYLEHPGIDAAIAPLPVVSSTGLPMGPMVATKGYSMNVHARGERARAAIELIRFMTSEESERLLVDRLKVLPSRTALLEDPGLVADPTLAASVAQMQVGHPMPVVPELRAVWDAMRPAYQALLGGELTARQAAERMQAEALRGIARMNQHPRAGPMANVLRGAGVLILVLLLVWQRSAWGRLVRDWRRNRFAYLLIGPALLVILLTIVYPFCYNIVLSFSNMSLRNFQTWQVTGIENYQEVLADPRFYFVLWRTVVWTVVCVFFHVAIGLVLAVCLDGPIRGRSIYRVLLILPWAIPAYITALTWRGMFNAEYGAINLILTHVPGLDPVNWLGEDPNAMIACIITNVWLGFPFMMIISLGGMQGIPRELYEAARIDRVSRWKQFWHITLPMLRPVLIPAVTLGIIWTFNNLNVVWLVSNAGEPADRTHILVSYVYKAVFNLYQYGYGAALSMIIFLILLVFSLAFLGRSRATEGVAG